MSQPAIISTTGALDRIYRSALAWPLVLVALAITALLVRLATFTGLIGSDDLWYSQYAQSIADGIFPRDTNQFAGRTGMTIAVAIVYRLLGVSELTTVLLPLLASSSSVSLLGAIGARLYGPLAGLIAALLLLTSPIDIRHGSILVPESLMGFWILVAVWLFLVARERRSLAIALAAGAASGVAYLTKEPAVFVTAALVLFALWSRNPRLAVATAAGAAVLAALEMGYYQATFADPLHRVAAARVGVQPFVDLPPEQAVVFTPGLPERLFKAYPRQMLYPTIDFGVHFVSSIVMGGLAVLTLRRQRVFVLLWTVLPWLFMNFGSASLTRYMPIWPSARYINLTLPPLFVLTAAFVASPYVWPHPLRRRVAVAVLVIVGAVGLGSAWSTRASGWRTAEVEALRAIVDTAAAKNLEVCPAWVDSGAMLTYGDRQVEVWSATLAVLGGANADALHTDLLVVPDRLGLPTTARGACDVARVDTEPGTFSRRRVVARDEPWPDPGR